MAIDEKAPSELRPITFHLAPQIPAGASIVGTVQAFASRIVAGFSTTLAVDAAAGATTVTLGVDVKAGAVVTINPGSPTAEEKVKVVSTSGVVATLSHPLGVLHTSGTTVTYEPGWNARLLVDDTPPNVGSDVTVWTHNGADGQSYRVQVVAPLTTGLTAEEQRILVVTEHAPIRTIPLQPDIVADLEFGFDEAVALAGRDLASAIAWASREISISNTLAASVNPGDPTISVTINPVAGALLTLNPTGAKQEKLKVTSVSGTGPFVCTVNPTPDFDHASSEPFTFEPGVTPSFLALAPPAIVGATKAVVRKQQGGMSAQTYRITTLGTLLTSLERVQGSCHIAVVEV
jgi:hypothetical protein